jgi:hypothetical protein
VTCVLRMINRPKLMSSLVYKIVLRQINLMILPEIGLFRRHKIADLQTKQLKALLYYTHLKLSCQHLREAASHIIVLSIIPLS